MNSSVNEKKFKKSNELLKTAQKFIPLGAQTFSKSYLQWPQGISPLFIKKGKGAMITDVDGNTYIDFVNALMAITLGHCDNDVTKAVKQQLDIGTIFSLSNTIEQEVAGMIIERVPCSEKVRFGKNGSDATAGAIRIARAYTDRDRIAVCGYHGWQDWYIGSTARHKGVPNAIRELTHSFSYNDIQSLEELLVTYPNEFAAIILEPMNKEEPQDNFLQKVTDLGRKEGAVVIFDETITGFRFSRGGAQEYFNVTPDLATFGKGLSNGYPLSVITGSSEIMKECEEIFFSFTMGGESISLAAAKVVMNKMDQLDGYSYFNELGTLIIDKVEALIEKHNCTDFLNIKGHPSWSFLTFNDLPNATLWQLKSLWQQEIVQRGILSQGTHNLSLSHSKEDVSKLISVYDEVFPILREAIDQNIIDDMLLSAPIENLFKVR